MKKTIALSIAGLVMLGAAGQASATMTQGDLIMVGYNETTKEVGVDLGSMATVLSGLSTAPKTLATGIDFSPASGPSNLPVSLAFFEDSSNWNTYDISLYFATTKPTVPNFSSNNTNAYTFSGNATQIINNFNLRLVSDNTGVADPAYPNNSYDVKMNFKSNAPGNYGGMNQDINDGEAIIGTAPVDMYLYHIVLSWDSGLMELVPANATQDWTAKLTLDNGTLTAVNAVQPSNVPVPATALLFGSSLLGLLGIRRKNS